MSFLRSLFRFFFFFFKGKSSYTKKKTLLRLWARAKENVCVSKANDSRTVSLYFCCFLLDRCLLRAPDSLAAATAATVASKRQDRLTTHPVVPFSLWHLHLPAAIFSLSRNRRHSSLPRNKGSPPVKHSTKKKNTKNVYFSKRGNKNKRNKHQIAQK